MLEDVHGILFDLDGTLIDSYQVILLSMRYTVNEIEGLNLSDAELMRLVGTPLQDQMVHFAGGDQERGAELTAIYREHNHAIHDDMVQAFSDTVETLDRFQQAGIKMGVVTSKRRELAERGARISGLLDYFDVFIGPDDWPEHKPHPGPILEGCRRLGMLPEHCLYVGDSPYDMQAGNAAGCRTVAALWGMFSREDLMAENPTVACDALSDLEGMLKR